MNEQRIYLALCIAGTVLPLSQFIPWLTMHGIDPELFVRELFSTRIGAFFGLDVIVSAMVCLVLYRYEGRRCGMPSLWLPVVATFCIGVSLGLPLFFYLKARLENQSRAPLRSQG